MSASNSSPKDSTPRIGEAERKTAETHIQCTVNLDGTGKADIKTGVGFLDHMFHALACHSHIDISLTALRSDAQTVDDHHVAEDAALTLGIALDKALGSRTGIFRFGSQYAPLEDALARACVDLACRPFAFIDLGLKRERIGDLSCENIPHVLRSLTGTARFTLHLDVLRGENDHHRAEAAFKALALALRAAVARDYSVTQDFTPSTKQAL